MNTTHPHLIKEWIIDKNKRKIEETSAGHDGKIWWKCNKCSHEWQASVYNRTHKKRPQGCPKCAKGATSSRGEKQIYEFLINNGQQAESIIQHKRLKNETTQRMFELDLYIPEKKIAIEFNGVYYHSEKFVERNYHYNKYKSCWEKGIQLLQIWEDDWNYSQPIIQKMLLHKLALNRTEKIHAYKTQVKEVPVIEATDFLENNHLQGSMKSSHYAGLYVKDKLISIVAIREEYNGRTFNIVRYAASKYIVGGFSKLISFIEEHYNFDNFVVFSDNCISDEELYKYNGFIKVDELAPDYTYLVKKQFREDKFKYKERIAKHPQERVETALLVYDAGKTKWSKVRSVA